VVTNLMIFREWHDQISRRKHNFLILCIILNDIYDTVLYNYFFCTEIIGGVFCFMCSTDLNIGGANVPCTCTTGSAPMTAIGYVKRGLSSELIST